MKIKKILATIAASTMMLSAMSITAGAATKIDVDSTYPGAWGSSGLVNNEHFVDFVDTGVEVTVNLSYEKWEITDVKEYEYFLMAPLNVEKAWVKLFDGTDNKLSGITHKTGLSDAELETTDVCAQDDGFLVLNAKTQPKSVKFTLTPAAVKEIIDTEGNLGFQVYAVTVNSVELAAPGGSTDKPSTDKPSTDNTDSPSTGNAGVAGLVVVAALATAGIVIAKRK